MSTRKQRKVSTALVIISYDYPFREPFELAILLEFEERAKSLKAQISGKSARVLLYTAPKLKSLSSALSVFAF